MDPEYCRRVAGKPPEMAAEYGIHIAPMHVTFGEETFDDGSFPVEKICDYYKDGGKLPKVPRQDDQDHYADGS